jgi:ribose transport system ATP-binding protein
LDEPSSDLSEVKKQHLFRIIRKYAENGNGILYLSNKLDEILQIGDRVTILKDGGTIDSFSIEYAKKNPGKILSLYFGREEQNNFSDDEFKDVIDTLLHTTELLTSEYELQDLLNLLVGKISETSKADGCSILLLDELSTNVVESFRHRRSNLPIFDLKEEIVSDVITSGQPLIINHLTEDEMARLFAQPNEVKALACVPIRVRTKINGAIEVFYTQKKNFTQEDIEVLMTFATQVAIAIENTRLLGRSTLLKEAHHRIKNNLQSIISLLILQLQTKSEKSLESIVWQIIDRIKTIASIHEILSQDEKGIGLINFNNLVKLIIANFNEKDFSGRVETLLEIDDLYVSYRTATSMGLIINELLANCFEHAFPEGKKGKIILRLHHDEDNVTLQVIDNGMGFKEVQPNSAGTLGLSLVKTLVSRDLRGSFEIASRMGTRVCIIFPKKQINY